MKWYFAVSAASLMRGDHDWPGVLRAAVNSANRNTTLQPNLLFDGEPSALTHELQARGVRVIPHRVSLYPQLAAYAAQHGKDAMWLHIAAAAFMRFDIPSIEQADDLVLYTDIDVMFLRHPNFFRTTPPLFFGASSQTTERYDDMNSGVMLMNVPAMREDHTRLCAFAANNLDLGLDQEVLRVYHKGRYDLIDRSLNWKPYWGRNPDAQIVHFHGPKPVAVRKFLQHAGDSQLPADWQTLLSYNPDGYRHYLDLWDQLADPDRVICIIDVVDAHYIAGWAVYERRSDRQVEFTVSVDGAADGTLVCDQHRPDVAMAGFGSARAGFRYTLPVAALGAPPRRVVFTDSEGLDVALSVSGRRVGDNSVLVPSPSLPER